MKARIFWWLESTSDRLCERPWWRDWMESIFSAAQRLSCSIFGHVPIAECHDPAHDSCAYCRCPTPYRAPDRR